MVSIAKDATLRTRFAPHLPHIHLWYSPSGHQVPWLGCPWGDFGQPGLQMVTDQAPLKGCPSGHHVGDDRKNQDLGMAW